MKILGIESSCDDTSIVLVEGHETYTEVITESNKSQIDMHAKYGGVVPEVAARMHTETIIPQLESIIKTQGMPDVIAVTTGPGLITSLMVGVETARLLSYLHNIPVVSVNHMEGHIYANFIGKEAEKIQFPALALIVSGGHTELVLMKSHLQFEKVGFTKDDAAGEAFDKIAKMIGLQYPGGPKISKLAQDGNPRSHKFPRPLIDSDDFLFSFSGLKTSALYYVHDHEELKDEKNEQERADFAAAIQTAIIETLVTKTIKAAEHYNVHSVLLAGGVAANKMLRETLQKEVEKNGKYFSMPAIPYCMDNAAMIATAGYFKAQQQHFTHWHDLHPDSSWEIPLL